MTWGFNIQETTEQPFSFPEKFKPIKQWYFQSGIVLGEPDFAGFISIVEDATKHPVPEWNNRDLHFNIVVYSLNQKKSGKVSGKPIQKPVELTKKHYRLNELPQIVLELFKGKEKYLKK